MTGALVSGLAQGAVFALLAIGIVLVFKGSRVLNLAQGEIGALAFLSSVALLGHGNANGFGVLILSMVLGAVIGIVVERAMMRPLVERPAVQGTIVTLGLAIAIIQFELIADSWFLPPDSVSYPVQVATLNTAGSFSLEIGGAALAAGRVVALIATALIATALYLFFTRTKFGLGVVAATSNNEVARILGIPVNKVYRFTWGVGGALAGLSAALIAPVLGSFAPFVMTSLVIQALAAAVIGGLDSVWGAIVGGLLVGVATALAEQYIDIGAVNTIVVLVLVVGTLLVRPRGLLGGAGAEI
ncbi:MAG: branched-chain amino acid ABC transporter permease [Nitriliruptorales bacterium]|nr:branched-chain amino acid ABC transporter permease [Nitriliruptorales bacterium]